MLSFGFNWLRAQLAFDSISFVLFIVSMLAWENSSAHFNTAITIAEACANRAMLREQWTKYAFIVSAQLLGSLSAILVTYLASKKTYTDTLRTITPQVPVLCPGLFPQSCSTSSEMQTYIKYEMMCSTFFVFSWLIVKNLPVKNRIATIVKPFIISQIYTACIALNTMKASGPLNPMLVIEAWFWGMGAYNDRVNPASETSPTIF